MKNTLLRLLPSVSLMVSPIALANDSVQSEMSHFAGNAAIAGATTVIVDKSMPDVKRPALTGFMISVAESVIGELIDGASGNNKFSSLDVAAGVAGAAAGSFAVHHWYIAPEISKEEGKTNCGVMATHRF